MKTVKFSAVLAVMMFLTACVTINIYFPSAKAAEAAKEMVQDIIGTQPNNSLTPRKDDGAMLDSSERIFGVIASLEEFFIPSAQAAEPDFNVNTPQIRKLQASMKARHASLSAFYASGAIGFDKRALVTVHDGARIGLKDRGKVNNLLKAENRDRNALYQAIADANGHPEWEAQVRAVFANTWRSQAAKGWWYQNNKGSWQQK